MMTLAAIMLATTTQAATVSQASTDIKSRDVLLAGLGGLGMMRYARRT